MAGRGVPGGALASRSSFAARLRPPVHRRQPVHRRLPGRGGAQPPASQRSSSSLPGPPFSARFCAPLCDAVTGSADAAQLIEVLERENLFLVPLDENRQWFRYHHLFAQLLRSQLGQDRAGPGACTAQACERLAPAARDRPKNRSATRLRPVTSRRPLTSSRSHWHDYVDAGRAATVRGWMRSLGEDRIAANPVVRALRGLGRGPVRVTRYRSAAGSRSSRKAQHDRAVARRDAVAGVLGRAAARRLRL